MTMPISFKDKKNKKIRVRALMMKYGITMNELKPLVSNHYTTIRKALGANDSYYNEDIIKAALSLVSERQKALEANKHTNHKN